MLLIISCSENESKATVEVKNEVSNVRLQEVIFDGYLVAYDLLPGESDMVQITDDNDEWPKSGNISFLMVANDNKVFLGTDSVFILMPGDDLQIVIDNDTPVSSF